MQEDPKCFIWVSSTQHTRISGVSFLYLVTRTTNENGKACLHYKRHGVIEVSSKCTNKVKISTGKGRSSTCPARFNSELTTTKAKKPHNKCTPVKLIVPTTFSQFCPVLKVDNGKRYGRDLKPGAEVTFQCDKGYYMLGSQRRICLECGKWSGERTSCVQTYWERPKVSTTFAPYGLSGATSNGTNTTTSTQSTSGNFTTTSTIATTTENNEVPFPRP